MRHRNRQESLRARGTKPTEEADISQREFAQQSNKKAAPLKNAGISLVVIVKNEEERITSFLNHHKTLVKEMIILDTGSTDNTVALAKQAGAVVQSFTWCDDFSAARNEALKFATLKWALCIDADERIATSDFQALQHASAGPDCCYVMPQRNYYSNPQHSEWVPVRGDYPDEEQTQIGYFTAQNTKFFPCLPALQFEGRVHESVLGSAKAAGIPVQQLPVPIHHYGYVISDAHNASRNERYGALLEKKIAEHPGDVQAMEEYATHLLQAHKAEEALPILQQLDAHPKTNSNITRGRILLGTVRMAQGKTEDAGTIFRRAVAKDPSSLFPYVELLKFLAGQRLLNETGTVLTTALKQFGEHPQLLREQSRYLIETRQIHDAAIVTRKVAELFPTMPEYAAIATRCEALSKKMKSMDTSPKA